MIEPTKHTRNYEDIYARYVQHHFFDILEYIVESRESVEFISRKHGKVFKIILKSKEIKARPDL
jgi:hypothetical protein